MEPRLTTKEGYAAMYLLLCELYEKAGYDQLGGILGGMSLLDDDTSADPAYWNDWLRMVDKAKGQQPGRKRCQEPIVFGSPVAVPLPTTGARRRSGVAQG
jgi:hypothetical protein